MLAGQVYDDFHRLWDYDFFNVDGLCRTKQWPVTMSIDCMCISSACMRWVPVGPERIGSLLAPVRAVFARPCAQRVAISGPLGSRIVAAQRPVCGFVFILCGYCAETQENVYAWVLEKNAF